MNRRGAFVVALAVGFLSACQAGWTVERDGLAPDVMLEGRAVIRALDASGECGPVVSWSALGSDASPPGTELDEGTWCFEVEAWSPDCEVQVRGSVQEGVPRTDDIITPLSTGTSDTLRAACDPPRPTWPQGLARVPAASLASLRAVVPLRREPHHPRPDSLRFEARPCSPRDPACARDGSLENAGRSVLIQVEEDRERYVLPLEQIPGPDEGWRGRIGWRVFGCYGERCVPSDVQIFVLTQSPRDLNHDADDELVIGEGPNLWVYASGSPDQFASRLEPCGEGDAELSVAALGDTDGDGRAEMVVSGESCDGTAHVIVPGLVQTREWAGAAQVAAAGDLDGDGLADAFVREGGDMRVRFGGETPVVQPLEPSSFEEVAAWGDLDGDGFGDAAWVNGGALCVVFGGAREDVGPCVAQDVAGVTAVAMARDGNGDDLSDLAALTADGVSILAGAFGQRQLEVRTIDVDRIGTLVTGDLNEDGVDDLILAAPEDNRLEVYLGTPADAPWEARSYVYEFDEVSFSPGNNPARQFGRSVRVTHGQMGVQRFDLAVAGREGGTDASSFPLVYLFEWSGFQLLSTIVLSSPLGPDHASSFGAVL